jgi:ComEC/Rec2-related protein
MALALGCIASVICGAMLMSVEAVAAAVVLALLVLAVACVRASRVAGAGAKASTRRWWLAAVSLCVVGLARGGSIGVPSLLQVAERGWPVSQSGAFMRELEVVGASEPGVRCEVELRDPQTGGPAIRVSAPPESCPLAAGQRVAVPAQALAGTWREALLKEDVDLDRAPVIWSRPSPAPEGLQKFVARYWHRVAALRQRAWASTRGDPSASLVVAVGLGLNSALPPEDREALRASGLGHLIAVSGLNVAVAAVWFSALVRRGVVLCGGSPRWACVIAWLPLWGYIGLTGAPASAVRAALMLIGIDLATLSGRPHHGPTLLASTAAGMLLWQPQWLFDPGFALSVAAMAAIVTAPRELGVLAMSWRVTWATAPLSVLWFDVAALHGLIGNAFALPIFALLMPLALVAVLAPGGIGQLASSLAQLAATPILDLAAMLAELPSAGAGTLLWLALGALVLHRLARRRSLAHVLPPVFVCVLTAVVAVGLLLRAEFDRRRVGPLEFDWVALGSVHSRSLLVADPAAPSSACLHRPTDSLMTWLALLELLEVRRLSRVEARLPDPERSEPDARELDPGAQALLEQLERAGIEGPADPVADHCQPPPPADVRAALRACQFRQGGQGRVLVRSHAGVISCRIDDRWVMAPELANPDE